MKRLACIIISLAFLLMGISLAESTGDVLEKGSKGEAVIAIQNRLNELGYSVGKADGDYGNKTKTAVEDFQRANELDVTGIVDQSTHDALFSENAIPAEDTEAGGFSDLVEFKSIMMSSVSDQINSAADLTATGDNRAILAALLSLEFAKQRPDFTINYKLPIFACVQGNIAAVAIGGEKDYAVIIYQSKPLSTSYGILYGNDPAIVRATMESTNQHVWTVDLDKYNEKLAGVVSQLG